MSVKAYPLHWPKDWARVQNPQVAKFETSLQIATKGLFDEIRLKGGRNIVLSSNMMLREDGMPFARQPFIEDSGVAVYWEQDGAAQNIACDKWTTVKDNIQALCKTIEALRGIERWGSSEIANRAYGAFLALPAPGQSTVRSWREVIGVDETVTDLEYVRYLYKKLRGQLHPDRESGDEDKMEELNRAWAQAQEALS